MALFKTFRGKRADLGAQELRDGFAYFCTDDGTFHIDFLDTDGIVKRKQINAKDAETLLGHSIEEFLLASENGSFAHGNGSAATGNNSYAGGQETLAKGWHSHAEGHLTQAIGYGAHAENGQTKAIGGYSHAEGYLSKAEGSQSHSEGQSTQAIGNNSHAEGQDTQAIGDCAHAEGLLTVASGANSHAEGLQTQALSIATSATGLLTKAGGKAFKVVQRMEIPTEWGTMSGYTLSSMTGIQAALAEATSNGQSLYYAVHMDGTDYYELGVVGDVTSYPNTLIGGGYSNTYPMTDLEKTLIPSVGSYLLIAGCPQLGDTEIGAYATAEGVGSCAQHYAAHAEGVNTYAIGPGAHAEGVVAHAVHIGSHAEGYHTVAGGAHSHAGGSESEAGGENAFAHGEKVYAYGKNQTVFGQYNKEDPDALFIIGGGESHENRKNLFTVKKDGSIIGLNTSNALTKTASGETIAVTDISPIQHEMNVCVRSKNLCPESALSLKVNGGAMSELGSVDYDETERKITLTEDSNDNSAGIYGLPFSLEAEKYYTFSCEIKGTAGKKVQLGWLRSRRTVILTAEYQKVTHSMLGSQIQGTSGFCLYSSKTSEGGLALGEYLQFRNIQIEEGTIATDYSPYVEDISAVKVTASDGDAVSKQYDVNADGTVDDVTSIYPNMTLITNTSGAVIDCTYNRDINRVLDDTGFMYDHNPVGTGSFSMNRKVGSEVGDYSFTEGYSATAAGKYSHAGGEASQAKSDGAFAHGQRVTADADYQATFGTYNEVNTDAALVVGNGSNSTKKNAFEVQKNGNAFVKGDLYIGGTGSTQASAKQVATKDSISAMEQRINNLEDITSSTGGVFFEDADVAYVKTIPENVAPYASLNKVGGMGIYKNKFANLLPSNYKAEGQGAPGDYMFHGDENGVIIITDDMPVEEWTSEPWFGSSFSLGSHTLPAGTYTVAIYYEDSWCPPFGLAISGATDGIYVGGCRGYEPGPNPYTFTLDEETELWFDFSFDCGGSIYCPVGEPTDYQYKIMINKGSGALPWVPYTGETDGGYTAPAKVTSIEIIGKNVLDYGVPRIIQDGNGNTEGEAYFEIRDNGTLYIRDMRIPVPMGPDSIYGTSMTATISLDINTIYPAGTYSMGTPVEADGSLYLTARAKSLDGTQSIVIQGSNNIISTPFTIQSLELTYEPSYDSYSMPSVEVPLVLVRGSVSPVEVMPSKRSHVMIPETLLSREDYGVGVYDTHSKTLYTNSIDFDNKKYVKNCLIYDLPSQSVFLDLHESKINTMIASNTIQCSDPNIAVDIYENSDTDPNRRLVEIYAYSADPDNPIDSMEDYLSNAVSAGTPIKVFFGTNLTEEIDISAELAGIDNYIPVEAGGLIYFNNDKQEAVPSTIEYQAMMKKGEIEEL